MFVSGFQNLVGSGTSNFFLSHIELFLQYICIDQSDNTVYKYQWDPGFLEGQIRFQFQVGFVSGYLTQNPEIFTWIYKEN